ncbi:uncharacterized protein LOC128198719 [Bicyclus anynana]|uniref:Uncharacterized protein LOC128198719 n=1 Tax=Bicyclus anynana TaxID=110368 RepID=A0ABM3LQL8_BICAN|nr:uncharacterized protein LOC128198719 [Bicyclus anynana]
MSKPSVSSPASKEQFRIKLLENKRDVIFACMQKMFDSAIQVESDNSKLSSLLHQASNIDTLRKEFETILDLYNEAQFNFDPNHNISYQSWTSFEDMHCFVKRVIHTHSNNKNENSEGHNTNHISNFPKSKSHLPPIDLMEFDGQLTRFPLFYQQFKNMVHDNPNLSKTEKVFYLVGRLKGKAALICSGLPATAENYPIIWESLIQKYDDPRSIACAYLNQLLQFKPLTNNNSNGLDSFITTFDSSVEALKQLNIDLTDFIFLHLATLKLDAETLRMFEIINRKKQIPTYKSLIEFVKEQSKAISRSDNTNLELHQNKSYTNKNNRSPPKPSTKSFVTTSNINSNSSCNLCKGNQHAHLYSCPSFMKLSPQERHIHVKSNNFCNRCLSTHHKTFNCSSQLNCKKCLSAFHHTALHFNQKDNNESKGAEYRKIESASCSNINNEETLNTEDSNHSISVCNVSYNSTDRIKTTTLLGTAKVKVCDKNNRTHLVRCLIDPASHKDYITIDCCKNLSLPINNLKNIVKVQGIGETSQNILGISEIKFKSRFNDEKEYIIRPLVVNKITSKLPNSRVDLTSIHDLIKDIPLADDDFSEPGPIEILLGVNMYCKLAKTNKISNKRNMPSAFETALGFVIMGEAPMVSKPLNNPAQCFLTTDCLDKLQEGPWPIKEPPSRKYLSPDKQKFKDKNTVSVVKREICKDELAFSTSSLNETVKITHEFLKTHNQVKNIGLHRLSAFNNFKFKVDKPKKVCSKRANLSNTARFFDI